MATEKPTYYITTPIYYPSGKLHIGNSYTTIACDAEAASRLNGYDVFFPTGTDEHGLKIEQKRISSACSHKNTLTKWLPGSRSVEDTEDHQRQVHPTTDDTTKRLFRRSSKSRRPRDIYMGEYTGWYSVDDEEYFTESQLLKLP